MRTIVDNKAMLTNTRNEQSVEAEVDNFRENKSFDAFIATNKIKMNWNGKVYVQVFVVRSYKANSVYLVFFGFSPKSF